MKQENTDYTTIVTCDENGIHYPCLRCGANYSDELDALLCCIDVDNLVDKAIL